MEDEILDYFGDDEFYKGRIIAIKYFYFESQARLYAARLKEAGIRSFVSNANTITAFPLGEGGIGLHIREDDTEDAVPIIREMDKNNRNEPQNISFHDADREDIEYEKQLAEKRNKIHPVFTIIVFILLLLIFRAFLRANGFSFWGDAF